MQRERKGRPKVFDDARALSNTLLVHAPQALSRAGALFPDYPITAEVRTDVAMIKGFQALLLDLAKLQSDLRLSFPALTSAIKNVYAARNVKGKLTAKANVQAVVLNTVCRHWLRDVKTEQSWASWPKLRDLSPSVICDSNREILDFAIRLRLRFETRGFHLR